MHTCLLGPALSILCTVVPATAMAADIYSYVDAGGVAHFSDVPDSPRYQVVLSDPRHAATRTEKRSLANSRNAYANTIRREAARNGLDPLLLDAVIHVESGHNPRAVSPRGAVGLMQLMPATAIRYGVSDPLQADPNIRAGARYLRDLMVLFDNDARLALAAYNAGEGAVLRHNRQIPPYAETQRYVPKVLQHYAELQQASLSAR